MLSLSGSVIFEDYFDFRHDSFSSASKELETQRRLEVMSLFKEGYADAGGPQALGTVYIMLLEDHGTNALRLQQAGLVEFIDDWLKERLFSGKGGPPVENEENVLALNIFRLMAEKGMVSGDVTKRCTHHIQTLLGLAAVTSRPSSVNLPFPVLSNSPSFQRRTITLPHFDRTVTLTLHPLCIYAIEFYIDSKEKMPLSIPDHVTDTRDADVDGMVVTAKDVREFNEARKGSKPPRCSGLSYIHELSELSSYHNCDPSGVVSPYVLGNLTGMWCGTLLLPVTSNTVEDTVVARWPLYVDFQEYTRIIGIPSSEKSPVEYVNEGMVMKGGGWNREGWEDGQWDVRESRDGIEVTMPFPGWLPSSSGPPYSSHHSSGSTSTTDSNTNTKANTTLYKTHAPFLAKDLKLDATQSRMKVNVNDTMEIVFTGKTPHAKAKAWGDFLYFGKVRMSDGMVVISRKPVDATTASRNTVFFGYLSSSDKLVGRWMFSTSTAPTANEPLLRGIFSLDRKQL